MSAKTAVIYCQDPSGHLFPVPAEAIFEQTAVFGILIEGQKVLLLIDPETGLLTLPGGVIDHHQTFDQGLRQIFRRTTGADTLSGPLVMVTHTYRKAAAGGARRAGLYFQLGRAAQSRHHFINFDNPQRPQWIPLRDLRRSRLLHGYDAIQAAAALNA